MPVPIEILKLFGEAHDYFNSGRIAEAQAAIYKFEMMLASIGPALNASEMLYSTAAIATMLKKCDNLRGAAQRLEKVCELALRIDPCSPQTYGDFYDLGECYEKLGELERALSIYRRGRLVCEKVCPSYMPALEEKIGLLIGQISEPPTDSVQISMELKCSALNYSLEHSGLPVLESLLIRNDGEAPLEDISINVVVPGYSLPGQPTHFGLAGRETKDISSLIRINLIHDRVSHQLERAKVPLEVFVNDELRERLQTWVLAYNELSLQPGHEKALAAFVHPNNEAVRIIARQVLQRLQERTGSASFLEARSCGSEKRIDEIAGAVYSCLATQYDLAYDHEPPCWESTSQRVRFPDEVLVGGAGTCLDFMLLVASVLENVLGDSGAQPVLIITFGAVAHALIGCWRERPLTEEIVITDASEVVGWAGKELLVLDSTGFVRANPFWGDRVDFEKAAAKGIELLKGTERLIAVNLAAARPDYTTGRPGVTPMPFRCEPPYGESALRTLWFAHRAWEEAPTTLIQSAHLLRGLLRLQDGATRRFFDTLANLTANPMASSASLDDYLAAGLRRVAGGRKSEPEESEGYAAAKQAAKIEARRLDSLVVTDVHLLFALLRNPGSSVTKALRHQRTSPEACLALLEHQYPAPAGGAKSEFPSETLESG